MPGREHLRTRVTELLGAGTVSAPSWRGDRQFFMRRTAEQEHAVLLTVDPDGTERVLVDPMALDPTGATTLDAWQPSKEGHLLAYQLSEGGTEESVLRVMDVATGERRRRPDRPGALLPGRLAARRRGVLLRPPARPGPGARRRGAVPPPGLAAPARQPDRTRTCWCSATGMDKTNYYGVTVSMDGRWLVVGASAGTAPRNDLWLADLSAGPLESPRVPGGPGGRRRQHVAARRAGRPGRTSSPTGTRRAAGSP